MAQDFKRMPAIEKDIIEITEKDIRVKITGTVVDVQDNVVILDDGTGKVKATFNNPVQANIQTAVRIMGRVIPLESGVEIQGEILQNMEKLDIDAFKKLRSIKKA